MKKGLFKKLSKGRFALAVIGMGLLLFAGATHADDWPQWRGPKRDGISQEKNLLKTWPKEGPKRLWHVKDIGYCHPPCKNGSSALLILLANSGQVPTAAGVITCQNAERRVRARGMPPSHSPTRTKFRATAVSRCPRCTLANPT